MNIASVQDLTRDTYNPSIDRLWHDSCQKWFWQLSEVRVLQWQFRKYQIYLSPPHDVCCNHCLHLLSSFAEQQQGGWHDWLSSFLTNSEKTTKFQQVSHTGCQNATLTLQDQSDVGTSGGELLNYSHFTFNYILHQFTKFTHHFNHSEIFFTTLHIL